MGATKVNLTYVDGTTESVPLRPLGLVAAERHFKGDLEGHRIEMTLWAAWYLKHKPGGSFDEWLVTLDGVEEKGEDEDPAPLDEEPSPDSSPS